MTNAEAKSLLVKLYANWYKVYREDNENYSEAVSVAISALTTIDDRKKGVNDGR